MIRKSLTGLLLLLYGSILNAQKTVELLSVSHQYSNPERYDSLYAESAYEQVTKVELTIPWVMPDSNIWYTSMSYDNFYVNSNNVMPLGVASPIRIQGISLRTGLIKYISNNRALYMLLAPRMQGDFKNIGPKTFQPGAIFFLEKEYRKDFVMRFGCAYFHDYSSPFFVPLVYIYRQVNEKFKIVGTIPQDLRLHYTINDRFAFGGQQYASYSIYHLGDKRFHDDYIFRTSINFSLYVRYKIIGPLCFEAFGGYAYDRDYAQYSKNDKLDIRFPIVELGPNRISKNTRFDDGLFASIRLVVDFPIPD